jgi:predicted nucleic acid-binding Zn ribbon protein
MRFPIPLGDVARQEFSALGLAERMREAEIWRLWPVVVGPVIAARAMPLRIIKGTLTVAVSSGPWMQELRFLTTMMRDKLNECLGGDIVREIVLKAGRVDPLNGPAPETAPRTKRLTPRQMALIDGVSADIIHSDIREAFADLMKASLKNSRPD